MSVTRLEEPDENIARTRVQVAPGTPETRAEAPGAAAGRSTSSGATVAIPPSLAGSYANARDLTGGGEGWLLLADHEPTGEQRVIKIYLTGGRDRDHRALKLIAASRNDVRGHAHLVDIFEWSGPDAKPGWEVMEYCPHGSLADLIKDEGPALSTARIKEIVAELAAALEYLHGLSIPHRDLKPSNVLVRSLDPLDLVLADFGLARVIEMSREYHSHIISAPYAPAEQAISDAMDWWALGVIVAEMALGHHPLQTGGRMPDERVLRDWISSRALPLDKVQDPTVRQLCAGLTRRDPDHRWTERQVEAWLSGGAPTVAPEEPVRSATGVVESATPFPFDDPQTRQHVQFRDAASLATALAGSWDEATALLADAPDRSAERRALGNFLQARRLNVALQILHAPGTPDDARVAAFLVALDPGIAPTFKGHPIDLDGLRALAASGKTGARLLNAVYAQQVLREYGRGRGHQNLTALNDQWQRDVADFTHGAELLHMEDVETITITARAKILHALTDPNVLGQLTDSATVAAQDESARRDESFRQVADLYLTAAPPAAGWACAVVGSVQVARGQVSQRDAEERRLDRERRMQAELARRPSLATPPELSAQPPTPRPKLLRLIAVFFLPAFWLVNAIPAHFHGNIGYQHPLAALGYSVGASLLILALVYCRDWTTYSSKKRKHDALLAAYHNREEERRTITARFAREEADNGS